MRLARLLRHLFASAWTTRRAFPAVVLDRIEAAIAASEARHAGQIRFAVEAALHPLAVWRGVPAKDRALEVFSSLRVWDTEHNSGVLVYLLLADRDVEIVADRGIHRRVGEAGWQAICSDMERHFRAGRFEQGAVEGIDRLCALLAVHFPRGPAAANELPDRPVVL
jgi:uncharacterized membrane protein